MRTFTEARQKTRQLDSTAETMTVLVIPADVDEPIYTEQLEVNGDRLRYEPLRERIGGNIYALEPHKGVDFLTNEDAASHGMLENPRATYLAVNIRFAMATGEYPTGRRTPVADAVAWQRQLNLLGPVVVVGQQHGDWIAVPEHLLDWARSELNDNKPIQAR